MDRDREATRAFIAKSQAIDAKYNIDISEQVTLKNIEYFLNDSNDVEKIDKFTMFN